MHTVSNMTHHTWTATTAHAMSAPSLSASRQGGGPTFGDMLSALGGKPAASAAPTTKAATADTTDDAASAADTPQTAATTGTAPAATATPADAGAAATGASPTPTAPAPGGAPATAAPASRAKHPDTTGTASQTPDPATAVAASLLALDLPPTVAVPKQPQGSTSPTSLIAAPAGAHAVGTATAPRDVGGNAMEAAGSVADAASAAATPAPPGTDHSADSAAAALDPSLAPPAPLAAATAGDDKTGAIASASQATATATPEHAAAAVSAVSAPAEASGPTAAAPPADPGIAGGTALPDIAPGGSFGVAPFTPAATTTTGGSPGPDTASAPGAGAASDAADPSQVAPATYAASATSDDSGTAIRVSAGDLGTIEVTLGKNDNGAASVTVAADRPETLAVMAADREQMQSVLAQAGIEPAGHRIEYTLLSGNDADAMASTWSGGDTGGSGQESGARGGPASWGFSGTAGGLSQDGTQPRSPSKTVYTRSTTVDITA